MPDKHPDQLQPTRREIPGSLHFQTLANKSPAAVPRSARRPRSKYSTVYPHTDTGRWESAQTHCSIQTCSMSRHHHSRAHPPRPPPIPHRWTVPPCTWLEAPTVQPIFLDYSASHMWCRSGIREPGNRIHSKDLEVVLPTMLRLLVRLMHRYYLASRFRRRDEIGLEISDELTDTFCLWNGSQYR